MKRFRQEKVRLVKDGALIGRVTHHKGFPWVETEDGQMVYVNQKFEDCDYDKSLIGQTVLINRPFPGKFGLETDWAETTYDYFLHREKETRDQFMSGVVTNDPDRMPKFGIIESYVPGLNLYLPGFQAGTRVLVPPKTKIQGIEIRGYRLEFEQDVEKIYIYKTRSEALEYLLQWSKENPGQRMTWYDNTFPNVMKYLKWEKKVFDLLNVPYKERDEQVISLAKAILEENGEQLPMDKDTARRSWHAFYNLEHAFRRYTDNSDDGFTRNYWLYDYISEFLAAMKRPLPSISNHDSYISASGGDDPYGD